MESPIDENSASESDINKLLDDVSKDIDFEKVDRENEEEADFADEDDSSDSEDEVRVGAVDSESIPNANDAFPDEPKKDK